MVAGLRRLSSPLSTTISEHKEEPRSFCNVNVLNDFVHQQVAVEQNDLQVWVDSFFDPDLFFDVVYRVVYVQHQWDVATRWNLNADLGSEVRLKERTTCDHRSGSLTHVDGFAFGLFGLCRSDFLKLAVRSLGRFSLPPYTCVNDASVAYHRVALLDRGRGRGNGDLAGAGRCDGGFNGRISTLDESVDAFWRASKNIASRTEDDARQL